MKKEQIITLSLLLLVLVGLIGWQISQPVAVQKSTVVKKQVVKQNETKKATENQISKLSAKEIKTRFPDLPKVQTKDWNLILVNKQHALTTELPFEKTKVQTSYEIDQRIFDSFNQLMKQTDNQAVVVSAYRSINYQQQVYDNQYQTNLTNGMSPDEAAKETAIYVEQPGCSEHATGLALDIVGPNFDGQLVATLDQTPMYQSLMKVINQNGFVLRYPKGKESITGIEYEPWHFRYVGVENAKFMTKYDLTLEEYIELLNKK